MVFIAVQIVSCSCADSVWKLAHSPIGWEPYGFFFFLVLFFGREIATDSAVPKSRVRVDVGGEYVLY